MAWVEVGMSASEVSRVLGEPDLIEKQGEDGSTELWYYTGGGVLILRRGVVQFKGRAATRAN